MKRILPPLGLVVFLAFMLVVSTGLLQPIVRSFSPSLADALARMEPQREPRPQTPSEQDHAVELARQGQYDEALKILSALYMKDTKNQNVARDYTAVLSWAGYDREATTIYQTLTPPIPNYVIGAIGHSYRVLGQFDDAIAAYKMGHEHSPMNIGFIEGEIRSMADRGDLEGALAAADQDISLHGERADIMKAKQDIIIATAKRDRTNAVNLARDKKYPEALALLGGLYSRYPSDRDVTRDYLTVLDWAGGHDADVVALYKTLSADGEPDYVLAATGHAYRTLQQPEEALTIYQQGLQRFPDNVIFAEGVIRTLGDQKKYDEAIAAADADLKLHGMRTEIANAKSAMEAMKPKPLPAPKKGAKGKKR